MRYVAHIELDTIEPLTEDQLFDVAEIGGAAAGTPGEHHLGTTFSIEADVPARAVAKATARLSETINTTITINSIEVVTEDEEDRRLSEPSFPELAGVAEVAELLGVSRQRVGAVQRLRSFPAPVAVLRSGPVWRRGDLTRFNDEWERKPGRPKRKTTTAA